MGRGPDDVLRERGGAAVDEILAMASATLPAARNGKAGQGGAAPSTPEAAIIGVALASAEHFMAAQGEGLTPGDFADAALGAAWRVLAERRGAGRPVDAIMLSAELGRPLAVPFDDAAPLDLTREHARLVRRASIQRQREQAAHDLAQRPHDRVLAEQVAELHRQEETIGAAPARRLAPAADAIDEDWGRPLPPILPTGQPDLDRALGGGMRAESATVLIGCTGRGKSGLAIQIASHPAEQGHPVLFLTSELSRRQVLARFLAQRLRRPWAELYGLGPSEIAGLVQAAAPLRTLTVVELTAGDRVRDLADAYAQQTGAAPLVVLDYLQHAARRLGVDDPRGAVMALSQEITDMCKALRCAALVISSVSRQVAREDTSHKSALDFVTAGAESGAIEFDAGAVLYLDTDPSGNGGTAEARLHLAKSRFSPSGVTVGLAFDGAMGLFKPDPTASLSQDQREVLEAVKATLDENGFTTIEKVRKEMGGRASKASERIKALLRARVIRKGFRGGLCLA